MKAYCSISTGIRVELGCKEHLQCMQTNLLCKHLMLLIEVYIQYASSQLLLPFIRNIVSFGTAETSSPSRFPDRYNGRGGARWRCAERKSRPGEPDLSFGQPKARRETLTLLSQGEITVAVYVPWDILPRLFRPRPYGRNCLNGRLSSRPPI